MPRLRPTASRLSALPRELRLLLVVAAVLATAWAVVTAPLQGPDESGHYAYTQFLAETGRGPSPDPIGMSESTELGSAMSALNLRATQGSLGTRPANTELQEEQWKRIERGLTEEDFKNGVGPSPLAKNPQLYYVYEAVPYLVFHGAGLFSTLMAMRLWSGLLFVVCVALAWNLAAEVFGPGARLRVTLAAGVVALWPMLAFMAGVVNPDIALTAAYTAVLWAAVRLVRRGPTLGRVAAVFGLAAVTLLVQGRGVPTVVVALVATLVALLRHRGGLRLAGLARLAAGAVAALAIPVLLARVVLAPGTSQGGLYGGELNSGQSFSIRRFLGQTWQFYFERLWFMQPRLGPDYGYRQVVIERWLTGVFGGLEITFPVWVYDSAQVVAILALIGIYTAAVLDRRRLRAAWPVLAVLGTCLATLMLLLHAASYRALVTGPDPVVTGRYLLPLVPIAGLVVAWAVGTLPRRLRGSAAGVVLGVLCVLQIGGLAVTMVRFSV